MPDEQVEPKILQPIRSFLISCLQDESLPARCRLAAASALSADAHPASRQALAAAERGLNRLPGNRLGSKLLALAPEPGKPQPTTKPAGVTAWPLRPKQPKSPDDCLRTIMRELASISPAGVDSLWDHLYVLRAPERLLSGIGGMFAGSSAGLFGEPPKADPRLLSDARAAFGGALLRISEMDLRAWQPWDTHGDAIYRLADLLDTERKSLIEVVGTGVYNRALRNVRSQTSAPR